MKRAGLFLIILIILYSTYYDLTIGTLPNGLNNTAQATKGHDETESIEDLKPTENTIEPFQEVEVEPGYTVLSIVEHLHDGPLSASIPEIIYDFEQLNPGVKADAIQVGEIYLFPLYLND
ncbi:hypothetical protein [Halalkalibacter urbisdiaboli]|uniref:hypothetical protein n=1 Tax=Halalkalibacter urbisdiaboli TaxID=1960589 RepID=UPI000B44BCA5|nr:hypothetical protein [Halalkalibacter urbisdiaboli]